MLAPATRKRPFGAAQPGSGLFQQRLKPLSLRLRKTRILEILLKSTNIRLRIVDLLLLVLACIDSAFRDLLDFLGLLGGLAVLRFGLASLGHDVAPLFTHSGNNPR